ncbi:uridine phosphorylase 2-like [Ruditapes philippinarum]|uniref:uridine phosphorylase 2-like n=1 Tax=Ruditapes philippinarum TaxID=129788 RepID=UPI00295B33CF|nr:uridine phosphorylase 2-like [Ruditapes philippinarum]XP_060589970.1 uridine phosphorylase 2-like [Ruditapes philippinarum]
MSDFPRFMEPGDEKDISGRITPRDGPVTVRNPHLEHLSEDVLYHLDLSNKANDLPVMFSDVKFVCFGGSPNRMKKFAEFMVKELGVKIPAGMALTNISHGSDRYVLYKVASVLSVSHGMGIPSLSIVFHEVLKLLHYAKCTDVKFFRLGTSGGLGIEPGSVVITEAAVDGLLRPYMEVATLGMVLQHPAFLDKNLCEELLEIANQDKAYKSVIGKTMCTYDFYEGQGRLDGAFCDFTAEDKIAFLKRVHDRGIQNIEMESLCFAAMAHRAALKSAIICCTVVDRLKSDQITASHETLEEWQMRPQRVVAKYIRQQLGLE